MDEELQKVKLDVDRWRSQKKSQNERMPADLRESIIQLRDLHKDHAIAGALGLSSSFLKPKRTGVLQETRRRSRESSASNFIKLSTAQVVDKPRFIFRLSDGISIEVFK